MDDHRQSGGLQAAVGVCKDLQGIAAVYPGGGFVVGRLQAQLDPDGLDCIQAAEHIHDLRPQAVRPGAQGEGDDLRPLQGLPVEGLQPGRVPVGVGKGLEIGDELFRVRLPGNPGSGLSDLRLDGGGLRGKVPGAPRGAEGAAPLPRRPVPVGAGASGAE